MPFEIVRSDIVNMKVDAIVNTANPKAVVGSGCDAGIHAKAGPRLLKAREKIGSIAVGDAAITPAYGLDAKHVIHAVSPIWQGGHCGEEALLRQCYDRALCLALKKRCRSIAFPLLASGNYGFPKALALQTAVSAFSAFLMEHEMQIYLVVFNRDAFELSEKLFSSVSSYIDENYIQSKELEEYGLADRYGVPCAELSRIKAEEKLNRAQMLRYEQCRADAAFMNVPPAPKSASLDELLKNTDSGFSETLLKLIDRSGKKDAEIYKKANIDRKLFSKIRGNPNYRPSKSTAIAFALALELDLEETQDLIRRAGYTLSHSSKFDLIVEFYIKQKNYNIIELNAVLFQYDQPLIGS